MDLRIARLEIRRIGIGELALIVAGVSLLLMPTSVPLGIVCGIALSVIYALVHAFRIWVETNGSDALSKIAVKMGFAFYLEASAGSDWPSDLPQLADLGLPALEPEAPGRAIFGARVDVWTKNGMVGATGQTRTVIFDVGDFRKRARYGAEVGSRWTCAVFEMPASSESRPRAPDGWARHQRGRWVVVQKEKGWWTVENRVKPRDLPEFIRQAHSIAQGRQSSPH